jgi:hypothetical protein
MLRTHVRTRTVVSGLVGLMLGAMLFVGGMAAGSVRDDTTAESAEVVTLPRWFLPVWDAYGRDPAITPWFDFASLYDPAAPARAGAVGPTGPIPHGAAVPTGPQGPLPQAELRG